MSDFKDYKLGSIESPLDLRDYRISKLVNIGKQYPDSYYIKYNGQVKDQGTVGSCVAHSLSYIKEIQEEKESNSFSYFSPGFIYANRTKNDYQGEGMIAKEALKCLLNKGEVHQYDFPFNYEYDRIKPIFKQYNALNYLNNVAAEYKIGTYFKIESFNDLKMSLISYGPATVSVPIYSNFYTIDNENYHIGLPDKDDICLGRHQMTILGYDNDEIYLLNSWGKYFGKDGYCYIPFNYPGLEIWGVTDTKFPKPNKVIMKIKKYLNKFVVFFSKKSKKI